MNLSLFYKDLWTSYLVKVKSIIAYQDLKTLKWVIISKLLFRDFRVNQINHEESKNRGPQSLKSILRTDGTLKELKFYNQILKFIVKI